MELVALDHDYIVCYKCEYFQFGFYVLWDFYVFFQELIGNNAEELAKEVR